jgi:hypothetical protein
MLGQEFIAQCDGGREFPALPHRNADSRPAIAFVIEKQVLMRAGEKRVDQSERPGLVEWLERAYTRRDSGVSSTKLDPLLRTLQVDPRWSSFLRKIGLAD